MITKILAIQCFVKYDTTKILLDHLSKCYDKENYIVVFGIDSHINMPYKNREHWIENNKKVLDLVDQYALQHLHKDTIILKNEYNLGAYQTCYKLINYCMELSDFVIFIEDDIILGKDALVFYHEVFLLNQQDERMFAVSSSGGISQSQTDLFTLKKFNWIGSAEFGIEKKIWQKYGQIRGKRPHGDVEFGQACRSNNMYTICPLVQRSCRIGIHHPDSFSAYHRHNMEIEQKKCVPCSDQFSNLDYSNYKQNFK